MSRGSYPRAPMVAWYEPLQLLRTGAAVAISTILGRRSDQRIVEALEDGSTEYFDYSKDDAGEDRRDFWIDYVADVGDGFNSTYAVASAIGRETLPLRDPDGASYVTRRGRVLVFGGDLTYPVASRDQYEQRLVMPYEHALPDSSAPHPDVYAIPGNHDWYDSLVSFTRRFCSQRWFAGWRTQQRASYFALQLPHDWWLLGTDVQLDSDIDADQVAYFRAIGEKLTCRSRIILCNAEPHWIYQQKYGELDQDYSDGNLSFLEDNVLNRKISVFVAGDLHHYRRHSDNDGHHKIVAGGGGAFLHPTHDTDVRTLPGLTAEQPYKLGCSYPTVETSRKLTRRNLLFLWLNLRFGVVTGLLYLFTCRAMQIDVSGLGRRGIADVAARAVSATLSEPTALLWVVVVVAAMLLFTDTHSRRFRIFGGLSHAIAHLGAMFFIGWGAAWLVGHWQGPLALHLVAIGALVFGGGWIAGSLVLGAYLYVALNRFGRHSNEAFSSLAIPDWKNFLRFHIDEHGALRIYPIGIDRVARRWRPASDGPRLAPDDPKATPPRLIERPIVIAAASSSTPGAVRGPGRQFDDK
jgi:hypothetical protein